MSAPALSADMQKLRERFSRSFPAELARADRLTCVPAAFRHLLALELELDRAATLPRRYRGLVQAGEDPDPDKNDAVDRLVAEYGACMRGGDGDRAANLLDQLETFFTEPQIVELTLLGALARGFATFDAVMLPIP